MVRVLLLTLFSNQTVLSCPHFPLDVSFMKPATIAVGTTPPGPLSTPFLAATSDGKIVSYKPPSHEIVASIDAQYDHVLRLFHLAGVGVVTWEAAQEGKDHHGAVFLYPSWDVPESPPNLIVPPFMITSCSRICPAVCPHYFRVAVVHESKVRIWQIIPSYEEYCDFYNVDSRGNKCMPLVEIELECYPDAISLCKNMLSVLIHDKILVYKLHFSQSSKSSGTAVNRDVNLSSRACAHTECSQFVHKIKVEGEDGVFSVLELNANSTTIDAGGSAVCRADVVLQGGGCVTFSHGRESGLCVKNRLPVTTPITCTGLDLTCVVSDIQEVHTVTLCVLDGGHDEPVLLVVSSLFAHLIDPFNSALLCTYSFSLPTHSAAMSNRILYVLAEDQVQAWTVRTRITSNHDVLGAVQIDNPCMLGIKTFFGPSKIYASNGAVAVLSAEFEQSNTSSDALEGSKNVLNAINSYHMPKLPLSRPQVHSLYCLQAVDTDTLVLEMIKTAAEYDHQLLLEALLLKRSTLITDENEEMMKKVKTKWTKALGSGDEYPSDIDDDDVDINSLEMYTAQSCVSLLSALSRPVDAGRAMVVPPVKLPDVGHDIFRVLAYYLMDALMREQQYGSACTIALMARIPVSHITHKLIHNYNEEMFATSLLKRVLLPSLPHSTCRCHNVEPYRHMALLRFAEGSRIVLPKVPVSDGPGSAIIKTLSAVNVPESGLVNTSIDSWMIPLPKTLDTSSLGIPDPLESYLSSLSLGLEKRTTRERARSIGGRVIPKYVKWEGPLADHVLITFKRLAPEFLHVLVLECSALSSVMSWSLAYDALTAVLMDASRNIQADQSDLYENNTIKWPSYRCLPPALPLLWYYDAHGYMYSAYEMSRPLKWDSDDHKSIIMTSQELKVPQRVALQFALAVVSACLGRRGQCADILKELSECGWLAPLIVRYWHMVWTRNRVRDSEYVSGDSPQSAMSVPATPVVSSMPHQSLGTSPYANSNTSSSTVACSCTWDIVNAISMLISPTLEKRSFSQCLFPNSMNWVAPSEINIVGVMLQALSHPSKNTLGSVMLEHYPRVALDVMYLMHEGIHPLWCWRVLEHYVGVPPDNRTILGLTSAVDTLLSVVEESPTPNTRCDVLLSAGEWYLRMALLTWLRRSALPVPGQATPTPYCSQLHDDDVWNTFATGKYKVGPTGKADLVRLRNVHGESALLALVLYYLSLLNEFHTLLSNPSFGGCVCGENYCRICNLKKSAWQCVTEQSTRSDMFSDCSHLSPNTDKLIIPCLLETSAVTDDRSVSILGLWCNSNSWSGVIQQPESQLRSVVLSNNIVASKLISLLQLIVEITSVKTNTSMLVTKIDWDIVYRKFFTLTNAPPNTADHVIEDPWTSRMCWTMQKNDALMRIGVMLTLITGHVSLVTDALMSMSHNSIVHVLWAYAPPCTKSRQILWKSVITKLFHQTRTDVNVKHLLSKYLVACADMFSLEEYVDLMPPDVNAAFAISCIQLCQRSNRRKKLQSDVLS